MSSNTTEQALIQIERNLEKLESARKHVLDVTKNGSEISSVMVELVKKVEGVYNSISLDSDSFIKIVDANQKKLDQHTDEILVKSDQSINGFLDQFKRLNSKFAENINATIDLYATKTSDFIEQQEISFGNHHNLLDGFNNSIEVLKKSVEKVDFETQLVPLESRLDSNFTVIRVSLDESIASINKGLVEQDKRNSFNLKEEHKVLQKHLSNDVIQILDSLRTGFEEMTAKFAIFSEKNLSLQQETSGNITKLINNLQDQSLHLHKKNTELLEMLANKKSNNATLFYLTWVVIFCGFLASVYIIKVL